MQSAPYPFPRQIRVARLPTWRTLPTQFAFGELTLFFLPEGSGSLTGEGAGGSATDPVDTALILVDAFLCEVSGWQGVADQAGVAGRIESCCLWSA